MAKKDDVSDENETIEAEESPAEDAEPAQEAAAEVAEAAVEAAQEAEEPVEALVPAAEGEGDEPAADAAGEDEPVEEPAEPAEEVAEPAAEAPAEAAEPEAAPAAAGDTAVEPKRKRKRLPRRLRPQPTRPKRAQGGARKPIVRLEAPQHERGRRQERQGTVVSSAMDKTIVVKVDVIKAHPRYRKVVKRSVKFHAHDERNEAKVGDVVRIVETRPLSASKRWRLVEIVEAAK
jgi:small subunit ribosomal protein S17